MADRQPISAFGLQASNSAKKRPATSQRRPENPSKARGTLRFIQPSVTSNSASSPVSVPDDTDDDVEPVRQTASSWENESYMLAEHEPPGAYDETFKPPERDSQDETMPTTFRKTRHQPPRAIGRKSAQLGSEALFVEVNGQYTPPATSSRQIRGDRARSTSMKRPHEVDTTNSSDPVETPVAGPSRPRLFTKTPLTARRIETEADIRNSSSVPRLGSATGSAVGRTVKDAEGRVPHQKNWLSKRSGNEPSSSRSNGIQTKLTAFINDKASDMASRAGDHERSRVEFDLPSLSATNGCHQVEEEFDESVRFVSMRKQGKAVAGPSNTGKNVPSPQAPEPSRASTTSRPLPRRKKRKSDQITGSGDSGGVSDPLPPIDGHLAANALSSRLKSHKRFKAQQARQSDGRLSSENEANETSSLTSLSKGPSSEAGEDEAIAPGAMRVVRGRAGRAMKVVCSSDAEELAEDAELAVQSEKQKRLSIPMPSTMSSVVPDSQPWHLLDASLVERARTHPVSTSRIASEAAMIQQDILLAEEDLNRRQEEIGAQLDLDMEPLASQPGEETEPSLGPVRAREESRPFPFPLDGPDAFKVPLTRGHSSITISSLRHPEPSQGISTISNLAAKARLAVPSLTEDDFAANGIDTSIVNSLRHAGDRQEVGSSQESESLDFFRYMRKILPPPSGPSHARPVVESRPVERDDLFSQPPVQGPSSVARPTLDGDASIYKRTSKSLATEQQQLSPVESPNNNTTIQDGANQAGSVEETMLPLTLDTQLHRPGILSPNFQFRRRQPVINRPEPLNEVADQLQRTPEKLVAASPQLVVAHRPISSVTPQKVVPKSIYRSPESMIENVQTLATWSPAKFTAFNPAAAGLEDAVSHVAEQDKENLPVTASATRVGHNQIQESPDEFIDGTYGPIESLHLLETYHRGYTPKKESAVERRDMAMPRVSLRPRRAPTTAAFTDVDQAWKGAQDEDMTPKQAHSQRAAQSKEDMKAQSKLAAFGFLKNENVKNVLRPVGFNKDFEDEDELHEDEDVPEQTFDRRSMSPTPRKAFTGKVLGAVPVAPIDPRLRPAGIKEVQRRKEAALSESSKAPRLQMTDDAAQPVVKRVNHLSDDAVPSSQPSENQQDILNSDSSNDVRYAADMAEYNAVMGMFP